MGLFSKKKKRQQEQERLIPADLNAEDLEFALEAEKRYRYLDSDSSDRIAKYRTYDNFLDGQQWERIAETSESGEERVTHNYCEPLVRKYASLLMGEVPKLVVPRKSERRPIFDLSVLEKKPKDSEYDVEAPVEFDRSEAIEKILKKTLYEDNACEKEFYEGAYTGSGYGDTIFFAYWDKEKQAAKIENIFPATVRLSFATNNFRDIEYAFVEKLMSLDEILRKYNFIASADSIEANDFAPLQFDSRPMAKVKYYFDKEYYAIIINKVPIEITKGQRKVKHNYSRVPLFLVPNLVTAKNPYGESDLKNILSIQESYNKALSDEANLSRMYAKPKVIVQNPGRTNLSDFKSPGGKVIPVGKDTIVRPLEFAGQLFPMQNRIERIKRDFHDTSGMPEIAFGTAQGSIVTGVAMTAQFAPTLQIVRTKMLVWNVILKDMASFILDLYEKFGGTYEDTKLTYKEIINGWRYTEWQWGNKMPRDDSIYIQNELNKLNTRTQSMTRTMTNLGIESPQDELKQIMLEQNNPDLNPKLAIERAQMEASTGKGGEATQIADAEKENQAMTAGQEMPSVAKGKNGHQIHLETHGNFVANQEGLPPEIEELFDAHMAGHEQQIATGGGHGGARPGAGSKPMPEGAANIPALAATGNMAMPPGPEVPVMPGGPGLA